MVPISRGKSTQYYTFRSITTIPQISTTPLSSYTAFPLSILAEAKYVVALF